MQSLFLRQMSLLQQALWSQRIMVAAAFVGAGIALEVSAGISADMARAWACCVFWALYSLLVLSMVCTTPTRFRAYRNPLQSEIDDAYRDGYKVFHVRQALTATLAELEDPGLAEPAYRRRLRRNGYLVTDATNRLVDSADLVEDTPGRRRRSMRLVANADEPLGAGLSAVQERVVEDFQRALFLAIFCAAAVAFAYSLQGLLKPRVPPTHADAAHVLIALGLFQYAVVLATCSMGIWQAGFAFAQVLRLRISGVQWSDIFSRNSDRGLRT